MRLVEAAHQRLSKHLREGDCAIDATIGNGGDTCLLARIVGTTGMVYGFDVQTAAILATREALQTMGLGAQVRLFERCHSEMTNLVETSVRAAVFNLGYLPKGDHSVTTKTESTLGGLNAACSLLAPGGVLSVIVYPGHPTGKVEAKAVINWVQALDRRVWTYEHHRPEARLKVPPEWLWVERRK